MSIHRVLYIVLVYLVVFAPAPRAAGDAPARPRVGRPHPRLALWTLDRDRAVTLASLRGQKVLLVHFASWCGECQAPVSAWFERMQPFVAANKVVVFGIDHEQHADRARLFAQWKGIKETILHDPLDLSVVTELPMVVAIDEDGIVRAIQPPIDSIEQAFVNKPPKKKRPSEPEESALPDPRVTRRTAEEARQPEVSRLHADNLVSWGLPPQIDEAIRIYREVLEQDPKDAFSFFRLGVAYRIRYEQEGRQPGDFQEAVDAWAEALRLDPKCAIVRQRLQQYGPAVNKAGPPYEWIPIAQKEIAKRGEEPAGLAIEPLLMEMSVAVPPAGTHAPTSPKGKSSTDKDGQVEIEATVVPAADRKQASTVEVHLTLRPKGVQWANGEEPVRIWMEKSKTMKLERLFFESPNPKAKTSDEPRTISFPVEARSKGKGKATLKGEAVYCIDHGGKTKTLRQEFQIALGEKKPKKPAGADSKSTKNRDDGRSRDR